MMLDWGILNGEKASYVFLSCWKKGRVLRQNYFADSSVLDLRFCTASVWNRS
jgi:hypothetical protein